MNNCGEYDGICFGKLFSLKFSLLYLDATHNTFTDSCSTILWTHACLWLVNVGYVEGGGATEAANAKATQQDLMTGAGQSSPSPLAGISQSEDAALETWNRLNKMKWIKESEMNLEKKKINDVWEKWKMEDGKKTECWELQVNILLAITITIRHSCPNTGQCPNSPFLLKHTMRTQFTLGIIYNIEYTTKTIIKNGNRKDLQNFE